MASEANDMERATGKLRLAKATSLADCSRRSISDSTTMVRRTYSSARLHAATATARGMMWAASVLTVALLVLTPGGAEASRQHWDYIVVGAGPGGLQMGHFLEKAGRNYTLIDRGSVPGNFFLKYPRHDRLISINKRHTGKLNKDFNLRHDWNSLISDDDSLLFRHYSRLFLPHREDMLRYLADYHSKLGIRVLFNTEVSDIRPPAHAQNDGGLFTMKDQHGNEYTCRTLLVATGLGKQHLPKFEGNELTQTYATVSINPDDYEGKTVLILGRGNSAFELAESIYGATNYIHMIGRSRVRLAWSTHYVGDIRAVNTALLDTYQLKSLDAILEASIEEMKIVKVGDRLKVQVSPGPTGEDNYVHTFDNFALREPFDVVIQCLGFLFDDSIFANTSVIQEHKKRKDKFPLTNADYESPNVPGLFFVGGASHRIDFRKSAGGFIHGFRYTARATHRLLEWRNHGQRWPSISVSAQNLLNVILKRINEGSGFYQMFGVLGDVMIFRNGRQRVEYLQEVPVNLLPSLAQKVGHAVPDGVLVLILQYGANYSGPGNDVFRLDRAQGSPEQAHLSNFLHPVFYFYDRLPTEDDMARRRSWETLPRPTRLLHIAEDFLTLWDAPVSHIQPIRGFIEALVGEDLRQYFAEDCLKMALTYKTLPASCRESMASGQSLLGKGFRTMSA